MTMQLTQKELNLVAGGGYLKNVVCEYLPNGITSQACTAGVAIAIDVMGIMGLGEVPFWVKASLGTSCFVLGKTAGVVGNNVCDFIGNHVYETISTVTMVAVGGSAYCLLR